MTQDEKLADALLDMAAETRPQVSDALMARVLADAERARVDSVAQPAPRGLWAQLADAIGGWPAMGGVALAGVAGLWVGLAPPVIIEEAAADVLGTSEGITVLGADTWLDGLELTDG